MTIQLTGILCAKLKPWGLPVYNIALDIVGIEPPGNPSTHILRRANVHL